MSLKKDVYTYEAPWTTYALGWSSRGNDPSIQFRLAIGSFVEQYSNKVAIVRYAAESDSFVKTAVLDHPYPATKVLWSPDEQGAREDLLATTGDYLRIWRVTTSDTATDPSGQGRPDGVELSAQFNANRNSEYCAPLTSMDWNKEKPSLLGTSSIDTTCTIWDVETQQSRTQIIAHDEAVYDIAFGKGWDRFATAGADGSLRLFDLRSIEHSNVLFETPTKSPLLRVAWNEQDPNFLATVELDTNTTTIVDIRRRSSAYARLSGHSQAVTAIAWAPQSSAHLCTAGDDKQALIWALDGVPKADLEPFLSYSAPAEINNLKWNSVQHEWIAISFEKKLQILHV